MLMYGSEIVVLMSSVDRINIVYMYYKGFSNSVVIHPSDTGKTAWSTINTNSIYAIWPKVCRRLTVTPKCAG